MNLVKIPKPPTILLLILLMLSCGLLLLHTLDENISQNGLQGLKDKQSEQKEFYDLAR